MAADAGADRTIGEESPSIGVVGAGQLGRMLAEAATPLGIDVVVVDPTPDPPAARVATEAIVGAFDDPKVIQTLAERADVLTYEIELANPDALAAAAEATGVDVHPAPSTLAMTQDKLLEKRRLEAAGIPVAPYRGVDSADELAAAVETFAFPVMLKARRGGYDGRGNTPLTTEADLDAVEPFGPGELLVEDFVDFDRELSVMGVRGADDRATFPVAENVHEEEILRETIVTARAPEAVQRRATAVAMDVLEALEGRGVFGIELFEADGEILVNEIAPRPHNSGHYTIEGAVTSQFEQHCRAILGWPLGSTTLREPVVMANILGGEGSPRPARLRGLEAVFETDGAHLHWYGKREVRPLRKMGHVTCLTRGDDRTTTLERARSLVEGLTFA